MIIQYLIFSDFFLKRNSPIVLLSRIEHSVMFSFCNWLKQPQLKCFEKEPCLPFIGKRYERKRKLMLFACHFYPFLHHWWSWNCCRECIYLKRNDSVVHVVFLRSKTKLMAEIRAPVHLTVIILFTFLETRESLNCFFFFLLIFT